MQEGGNYSGGRLKEAAGLAKQFPANIPGRAADISADAAEPSQHNQQGKDPEKSQWACSTAFRTWPNPTSFRGATSTIPTIGRRRPNAARRSVSCRLKNARSCGRRSGENVSVKLQEHAPGSGGSELLPGSSQGQSILLDPEALKEVDATYDSPVTLDAKAVSLRTAMKKILAEVGLTYIIKEETIFVTSLARARDTMVVKRYYIGDILASMGGNSLPVNAGLPVQTGPQVKGFITPSGMPGLVIGGPVPFPQQTVNPTDMALNQAQAK